MTDQQQPITPPPELVREWNQNAIGTHFPPYGYSEYIATQAARWGADTELEACAKHLKHDLYFPDSTIELLRAARRPKPPSLKEQALDELDLIPTHDNEGRTLGVDVSIIRRALEALPND